ncbi:MHCK/EF2 kinase domain containing protein [Acanthamoeba castellanii str. Neff]|uniref:MHCK/EF2 kinase domain containing protein n=1 Tax=Acanthamoeba castellanii (strain ATCC 30010 / Neff) TaxID=1257118 RepID=L8GWF6_ACACF|nr:MHCK/EF2 kinase domain containing protein [Acanthamoeba castellanii str. Neff]ELR17549.1 MHCK/EF2 kinase domain containing protein [Acanthamoeba castellanii str. Neff]
MGHQAIVLGNNLHPFSHEKVINEEGDMVHIKTVITCLAAVCRVSTDAGKGSGFLTTFTRDSTPYLCIMTNNHVIKSADQALRSVAEFFDLSDTSKATRVSLRPDVLFITDVVLDFSLVACNRAHLRSWLKPIRLTECTQLEVKKDDVIHIIQHPSGGEKHMSMQKVVSITESELYYLADTLPGSSGSPVFKNWKLVALHSQGSPVHNMGTLMKRILAKCTSAPLSSSVAVSIKPPAPAPPAVAATSLRITNTGETIKVYSLIKPQPREWKCQTVRGLIEDQVMAEGSLRVVHKVWAGNNFYVIKRFKPHVVTTLKLATEEALVRLLQEEVVMQRCAWDLAARWNALEMPKNVQVNPLFVVKLADRLPQVWAVMEPMLEGADQSYVKYNDNCGGVFAQEGRVRETPQTFSHFTHLVTGGQWLVCDLQGVGDTFTDPQVHTNPRERCPVAGNHGPKGMDDFFATHQCSALCEMVKQRLLLRASSGDAVVSAPPRP